MASEQALESLVMRLQRLAENDQINALQEIYDQLRAVFAQVLFTLKQVSDDHYAWLLMNHDASCCLDKLKTAFYRWQNDKTNRTYWRAYKRELDDFRWIVETAMICKP